MKENNIILDMGVEYPFTTEAQIKIEYRVLEEENKTACYSTMDQTIYGVDILPRRKHYQTNR